MLGLGLRNPGRAWQGLRAQGLTGCQPWAAGSGQAPPRGASLASPFGGCGWASVLAARWPGASLRSLPLAPSTGQLTTSQPAPTRRERTGQLEMTVLLEAHLRGGAHHVCPVLFVRSEPLGSAHTQGEVVMGVTTRGRRSLQAISGAADQSVLWPPVIHSPPPCKIHCPLPRSLKVSSHFIISSNSRISSHQAQGWGKPLENNVLHGAPRVALLSVYGPVTLKTRLRAPMHLTHGGIADKGPLLYLSLFS